MPRPSTGKRALTNAERQARHRAKLAKSKPKSGGVVLSFKTTNKNLARFLIASLGDRLPDVLANITKLRGRA